MSPSYLYLTSTGRLARRLRHRFRLSSMKEGNRAWEAFPAMTLNAWLSRSWSETWPECVPAPELKRLHLWKSLARRIPPPSPLEDNLPLYRLLDDTYDTMIRHRINPFGGPPSTPLVEWRREICRTFEGALGREGLFHEAELPLRVGRALTEGTLSCPDTISLAGFDSPSPIEEGLLEILYSLSTCTHMEPAHNGPGTVEAVTLPSPEQERLYLIDRLVRDAQSTPLHRIGVVVPNLGGCRNSLERMLRDITGGPPPRDTQWFNITLGQPVTDLSLFQAALLPLRFVLEDEPRELFLSLILSPYYGLWQGMRHDAARADRLWRARSIDRGLEALLGITGRKKPDLLKKIIPGDRKGFQALFSGRPRGTAVTERWIDWLEDVWSNLGFPVTSDEADILAQRHLDEIMADMRIHLSGMVMGGGEFLSWIMERAAGNTSQAGGAEEAGIQIMGLVESRGLDFEKLYMMEMNDRSFPQLVRPLPLLDSSERRMVQGGTAESQYLFAERAFRRITGAAPRLTLLRAEQEEGTPLTPSPFWPDGAGEGSLDIWHEPGPVLIRAAWLQAAFDGLHDRGTLPDDDPDGPLDPSVVPATLSVSALETAVACPCRFFSCHILGVEPLETVEPAIDPRERGMRLHRILAAFTQKVRQEGLALESDHLRARRLLSACIDEALAGVEGTPHWEVERERWLEGGTSSRRGLLTEWLDREIEHRAQGWRCIAEEVPFSGLSLPGWPFSVRGRIDRIDDGDEKGIMCCDYKTGNAPSAKDVILRFLAPQLPLYVMALREGTATGPSGPVSPGRELSAGYLQLKSLKDLKYIYIDSVSESLGRWERIIAHIADLFKQGDFQPLPYPFSEPRDRDRECETCVYKTLCSRGLRVHLSMTDESDDDDQTF